MTTYSEILLSQIDQDSPVTQTLMTALRDNLLATMEGASGAPTAEVSWHLIETLQETTDESVIDTTVDLELYNGIRFVGALALTTGASPVDIVIKITSGGNSDTFFTLNTNAGIMFDITAFACDDADSESLVVVSGTMAETAVDRSGVVSSGAGNAIIGHTTRGSITAMQVNAQGGRLFEGSTANNRGLVRVYGLKRTQP